MVSGFCSTHQNIISFYLDDMFRFGHSTIIRPSLQSL